MTGMPGFSAADDTAYRDVVAEVAAELSIAAEKAMAAGLAREEIVIDPGLGFAKNARHSVALVARLRELVALGFPVLVGPSRKSFLAHAAAAEEREVGGPAGLAPPGSRLGGTLASLLACAERGARIVRVHDVAEARQALAVWRAIERVGQGGGAGRASAGGVLRAGPSGEVGRA
jgi:dihydropteroate synthase